MEQADRISGAKSSRLIGDTVQHPLRFRHVFRRLQLFLTPPWVVVQLDCKAVHFLAPALHPRFLSTELSLQAESLALEGKRVLISPEKSPTPKSAF